MDTQIKPVSRIALAINAIKTSAKTLNVELIKRVVVKFEKLKRISEERIALRELGNLSDHQLQDIGLSRADLIHVSALPKTGFATLELQNIARRSC